MNEARWKDALTMRHLIMIIALTSSGFSLVAAQPQGTAPMKAAPPPSVASLKEDLVIASHVLVDESFLETQGHVSVRLDANRFLMPWRTAPGMVGVGDIMEYNLEGNAADANGRQLVLERFIHTEIYRARPDIQAVVHGHTPSLIMFSSSNIPLQPLFSGAGFIAPSVPSFQNGEGGGGVNSAELGKKLAETMGKNGAVLMRGHGVVVAAQSLAALVPRALALDTNAKLVAQLLAMGDKSPIYIKPNPGGGGGGGAGGPVPAGGNDSREWLAYKAQVAAKMKK